MDVTSFGDPCSIWVVGAQCVLSWLWLPAGQVCRCQPAAAHAAAVGQLGGGDDAAGTHRGAVCERASAALPWPPPRG